MTSSEGRPQRGNYRARLKASPWPEPAGKSARSRAVPDPSAPLPGKAPIVILPGAFGLVVLGGSAYGARLGLPWSETAFWVGLLLLAVPVAFRLAAKEASRTERLILVLWLGLALFFVKVIHSPFTFTFSDEAMHAFNVDRIVATGHLFFPNSILPVTPLYPGLALVASAIVSTTGLSTFTAGLILTGISRLVLILALFLLVENLTGSARVAGMATLLYTANANFVFWSAQFAYESLALPLAIVVLYLLARRTHASDRGAYTVAALLLTLAVVISHHLTSIALVGFLLGATLLALFPPFRERGSSPWDVALVGLTASALWLALVAPLTIAYLAPVLLGAGRSAVELLGPQAESRELFRSATGYVAPLWERLVGLGSVALIVVGLIPGLIHAWRLQLRRAFALLLAGGSLAFLGMQALRLSPASWETANRSSEFLFLGVAFVLGLGAEAMLRARRRHLARQAAFAVYAGIIFLGGVIAGWQPPARLSLPYLITAENQILEPQGVTAAHWAREFLGPHNVLLADETNARLMLRIGEQAPLTGKRLGVRDLIVADSVGRGEREILQVTGARYVVIDRRLISWNSLVGLYFDSALVALNATSEMLDAPALQKFDAQVGADRLYDSGDLTIYDVGELSGVR